MFYPVKEKKIALMKQATICWLMSYPSLKKIDFKVCKTEWNRPSITVNVDIFTGGYFREILIRTFRVGIIFALAVDLSVWCNVKYVFASGKYSRFFENRELSENNPTRKFPRLQYLAYVPKMWAPFNVILSIWNTS